MDKLELYEDFSYEHTWHENPVHSFEYAIYYLIPGEDKQNRILKTVVPAILEMAEKGDSVAEYYAGIIYRCGYEVEKDLSESKNWFQKSAEKGFPKAEFEIGYIYYAHYGVDMDYIKALEWLKKAADHNVCKAQYCVAEIYKNGWGVDNDLVKAFEYYSMAASQGLIPALYRTVNMLYYGIGTDQDRTKAIELLEKASDLHDGKASFILSEIYEEGKEVTKDLDKAREYRERAYIDGYRP